MIDQHNSLSEKFLKKGFWLYLFSFIIAPIGYIIKIIISGELTVSEVGILYGVISLITLLSAFNDFGFTASFNYFIPKFVTQNKYNEIKTILTYALLTQISTGLIIASFFFFGADYISINYFDSEEAKSILKIFAFFFLGINIFQIISTFFISIQNTFYNKLIELLRMLFILGSVLYIFINDLSSLQNYSYSWIIGLYIGIIFAIYFFFKNYYSKYLLKASILWNKELFKKIFKYAFTIFIGTQAASILSQIDMQMIIYLLGTKEAGYYTNYLSIITIPFVIIGPIFALLFPMFSEMHSKGEIEKIKLVKNIFQKNFLSIGISIVILFFVFSEVIAYILFDFKFIESGIILKYSILFLIFNFLLQINIFILGSVGKVKERVKVIFIGLLFNILLNYILIKTIGVYGAALATGMGWTLIWILSEYYLGKDYRVEFHSKYILKNITLLGIIGIFSYYFINPLFEGLSRLYSLGAMFIISIIYFGIFIIINYSDFKFFILEIKRLRNKN